MFILPESLLVLVRRMSAFLGAVSCTLCLAAPLEKDERDTLRSTRVYHIMNQSKEPLSAILRRLKNVPDSRLLTEFMRTARAQSKDPGSASSGGDLGLLVEGTMDASFESGYLPLAPMQVSEPIKSAFGWHLILVTEIHDQPITAICKAALDVAQQAVPITPPELLTLSRETQELSTLASRIREFIGVGWSSPMNWNGNLAFVRLESATATTPTPRVVIHSEYPFARYSALRNACRRSARHSFDVNCRDLSVAVRSHSEYEGRGGMGRRLSHTQFPNKPERFETAKPGQLGELLIDLACPTTPK